MSRARHERLQELFLSAVDLAPEERRAFLAEACGADAELLREAEELLAADGLPEETALAAAAPAADVRRLVRGTGPYRVVSEIGRGGMGVVYLAERADGAFERHVALKVVQRRSGPDPELESRFRSERRILASLDHPNIARLLDGGSLADGSPFLVMEYVEGDDICRYAQARGLSLVARLRLFLAVCEAVQAAHQSLVVHRDIKPGNVLVTAEGVPKLLDFGIAKILDPHVADAVSTETRFGHQPLTPRYAAPEQLTGDPVTTATDVYALGVLLYELLTGALPYQPQSGAVHHWIEAVCVSEPRRPSLALRQEGQGPRTLRGSLEGDVDYIVLKALRKEPHHRYPTAAELAADLRRHLAGRPVLARPATLSYRCGKFLRRHRFGVAAVLALILTAGGFTIGLARQLERTQYERDRAETVKNLLIEVFGAAGPGTVEGREPTAREVLDRGLQRIEGGLEEQPAVKAALLDALGRVYNNLGRLEEAAKAHEQALALRRQRRATAPLEYAESLSQLALVYLGRNDLERAEAMYREAWSVFAEKAGDEDRRAIACLDGLQHTLSQMGRYPEAESLARQVVELTLKRLGFASVESVVASGSKEPELVAVATTLGSLAVQQRQLGRYADAERSLRQAMALNRALLGEHHYSVAFNLNNLANLHANLEDYEAAQAEWREALEIAEPVLGADHPSVGSMRLNQGAVLERLGRLQEALAETSRAREIFAGVLGPEHPVTALAMSYTGLVEAGLGHEGPALSLGREGLELLVAAHGEEHPDVARALGVLARTHFLLGRHSEAAELYRRALAAFDATLGPDHPETLDCRSDAAEPLLALGRYGDAREVLQPALQGYEARGDLVRQLARGRFRLARALAGDAAPGADARSLAAGALATYREVGDEVHAAEVEVWLAGAG